MEFRSFFSGFLLLAILLQSSTVDSEGVRVWPQQESNQIPKTIPVIPFPSFTEEVSNSTVVVGRSATLKCSVENLNSYKIAWIESDTQTLLSIENTMITRNYRLRVSHSDATTWFLHIDEASMSDKGYYMCQINTVPPLIKQGYLEVVVPPNIVDEKLSADVEVSEDSAARLKCMATGYPAPEINFKRLKGRILRNGGTRGKASSRIIYDQGEIGKILKGELQTDQTQGVALTIGYLDFDSVNRLDMGYYLCIANNSVPPVVSKRVVLNVRYRTPEVEVAQQMLAVYRGDDVSINCTVTGYPRPVVFWQDGDGRMIISGSHYQVTETQLNKSPPVLLTTLKIMEIQPEDITSYNCYASIDNDPDRSSSLLVQLNEMVKPSTEISKTEVFSNAVSRQSENLRRKSRPQPPNPIKEVSDRYEKTPNSYNKPEVLVNKPSFGHGNFEITEASSGSQSFPLACCFLKILSFSLVVSGINLLVTT